MCSQQATEEVEVQTCLADDESNNSAPPSKRASPSQVHN